MPEEAVVSLMLETLLLRAILGSGVTFCDVGTCQNDQSGCYCKAVWMQLNILGVTGRCIKCNPKKSILYEAFLNSSLTKTLSQRSMDTDGLGPLLFLTLRTTIPKVMISKQLCPLGCRLLQSRLDECRVVLRVSGEEVNDMNFQKLADAQQPNAEGVEHDLKTTVYVPMIGK